MPGRALRREEAYRGTLWDDPACARRRAVLAETLAAFERADPPDAFHRLARENLAAWRAARAGPSAQGEVSVVRGDWGEVAGEWTRRHGETFAVLDMANAHVPGGAYVEGAPAQEENLFRRTDCHYGVTEDQMDTSGRYRPEMSRLLEAADGRVLLDTQRARVCIRGPEDPTRPDLGYRWLDADEIFPFYELRAAARDHRDGAPFDADDARRRIRAQLDTLAAGGVRHAVLSAFGCGAFRNPASEIARLYREALDARRGELACVVFAIHDPGYGPDNFTPFRDALGDAAPAEGGRCGAGEAGAEPGKRLG